MKYELLRIYSCTKINGDLKRMADVLNGVRNWCGKAGSLDSNLINEQKKMAGCTSSHLPIFLRAPALTLSQALPQRYEYGVPYLL